MNLMLLWWLYLSTAVFNGQYVLPFIKDINKDMNNVCATIVVDNVKTINNEIRDLMVKQEHMMVQVMEVKQMMKIFKEKKLERQCTFFILGDANVMLNHLQYLDEVYFRIHNWYLIPQDANENLDIQFKLDSNVFLVNVER